MTNKNQSNVPISLSIKWGIIIAIINILLYTTLNKFLMNSENMTLYYVAIGSTFVLNIVLLSFLARQQRSALGGFISFKQCFRTLFIAILIICVTSFLYQQIYLKFIDPSFLDRMKEATLAFTEKIGAGQEQLDDVADKMDKQIAESNSVSRQLLSVVWAVVFYSIIGFVISAIVRKNKPLFIEEENNQQFQH
ncbi:MAG TPA: DUF4199 domain-containing protein [Flavipsychrobacter sp.]|nr:DUF4199 domain-containing protein [Flavipsychrobacter sp.]